MINGNDYDTLQVLHNRKGSVYNIRLIIMNVLELLDKPTYTCYISSQNSNKADKLKQASSFWHKVWEEAGYPSSGVLATIKRQAKKSSLSFDCSKNTGRWIASLFPNLCQKLEACFNLSALSYLWNAVAPYSTFRLRSLCVNVCLPRSSCVNGRLPNTLLTCQDVPGSHSAFLCRVKGHTLTSCARRRGSLGTRLYFATVSLSETGLICSESGSSNNSTT